MCAGIVEWIVLNISARRSRTRSEYSRLFSFNCGVFNRRRDEAAPSVSPFSFLFSFFLTTETLHVTLYTRTKGWEFSLRRARRLYYRVPSPPRYRSIPITNFSRSARDSRATCPSTTADVSPLLPPPKNKTRSPYFDVFSPPSPPAVKSRFFGCTSSAKT